MLFILYVKCVLQCAVQNQNPKRDFNLLLHSDVQISCSVCQFSIFNLSLLMILHFNIDSRGKLQYQYGMKSKTYQNDNNFSELMKILLISKYSKWIALSSMTLCFSKCTKFSYCTIVIAVRILNENGNNEKCISNCVS